MTTPLEALRRQGVLSPLDFHFADTIGHVGGDQRPLVLLAAALASRAIREGQVCLDLHQLAGSRITQTEGIAEKTWPDLPVWLQELSTSPLCSDSSRPTPLVLTSDGRLYLSRYYAHEIRVEELIRSRLGFVQEPLEANVLRRAVASMFPPEPPACEPNWQRIAVELGMLRRLLILAGGPGTGKTLTVARWLHLLERHARAVGKLPVRVLLLAPTGKAAARLHEAVREALVKEPDGSIPTLSATAATIHRALGYSRPGKPLKYHQDHPLAADVVIVDEASLVDIVLMRRLLEAVPHDARLALVGDQHQLASVEAGRVFADLVGPDGESSYSDELATRMQSLFGEHLPRDGRVSSPIADSIVRLQRNYRFGRTSGIGALSHAIRSGNAEHVIERLTAAHQPELEYLAGGGAREYGSLLASRAVDGYRPALRANTAGEALRALSRFRVLCAYRHGPLGVARSNLLIERSLAREDLIQPIEAWYHGRPVLVVENHRPLELFNGDIGIAWRERGALRVVFAWPDGAVRPLVPARLPEHETVFAMSIHKSQGSEFENVMVVLPEQASPLLSRELFYTAVTRARSRVVIYGTIGTIRACVTQRASRASGLGRNLWGR